MAKKITLTEKKTEELKKMLAEKREELRSTRFASVGARPKDTNAHSRIRKEIARVLYELGTRGAVSEEAAA
ncbi:MAG: ribosomal protein L29 [Parcubacteria bacterium C7867-008]|nr:MAG: ribosomal protein L29 [Parcubacteria bacterium C7867-008]